MDFSVEAVSDILIAEINPLLKKHFDEVGYYKDIQLEPDFNKYLQSEHVKKIRVFTARQEGTLVGYAVFFVSHSLHHKNSFQALQDILYLDPQYRGKGVGAEFISWCDLQMKNEGIQLILQIVRNRSTHGKTLESMGYELLEFVYSKRLDRSVNE